MAARTRLSGRIYLAAGTADNFDLYAPAKRFSDELTAAGIRNQFAADDGDHGSTMDRKRGLVRFALENLQRE